MRLDRRLFWECFIPLLAIASLLSLADSSVWLIAALAFGAGSGGLLVICISPRAHRSLLDWIFERYERAGGRLGAESKQVVRAVAARKSDQASDWIIDRSGTSLGLFDDSSEVTVQNDGDYPAVDPKDTKRRLAALAGLA